MHRPTYESPGTLFLLRMSSYTPLQVKLKQRLAGSSTDTRSGFWDNIEIDKVDTTFIKFTISSVYTENENGFVEIKVYASKFGSALNLLLAGIKGFLKYMIINLQQIHLRHINLHDKMKLLYQNVLTFTYRQADKTNMMAAACVAQHYLK